MNATSLVLVGLGAMLGAWSRWLFAALLNAVYPPVPLGTVAANLLGSFLMGLAMVILIERAVLPPELRVAIITGFLGAFTTMSTFSAESVTLLLRHQYLEGAAHAGLHVAGSILTALAGVLVARAVVGS